MNSDQIVALHGLRQEIERQLEESNDEYVACFKRLLAITLPARSTVLGAPDEDTEGVGELKD